MVWPTLGSRTAKEQEQPVGLSQLTTNQFLFATRFANWHFSLPNKSNLGFFSENYRLILNSDKNSSGDEIANVNFLR